MEQLVKMVPTFEVRVSERDTISLNVWELTALQLWLLMAVKFPDAKPLWLKGTKFAFRKGDTICFHRTHPGLTRPQAVELINAIGNMTKDESTGIHMLGIHYPLSDSWQSKFDTTDLSETKMGSFIGYWREDTGESILPVKLRWSEDLGVWYGVKAESFHDLSFSFKNLTIGQI